MNSGNKKITHDYRSPCPISRTLDLIGDKWSLLILRDMAYRKKTLFGDFHDSPENISTNILSDRLKKLEAFGIVSKSIYQDNPVRYKYGLTSIGKELKPLIRSMIKWGNRYCREN